MDLSIFLRGSIIGLSIAAPVGPIGVLCIRRSLAEGRVIGLATGLGAASADAVYGFIAGFGITMVSSFLVNQQAWVRLLGGGFLCYLGIRTFFAQPTEQIGERKSTSLIGAYISTFLLTLSNPLTILSFAAIFAGLGLGLDHSDYVSAGLLVVGVFCGSALWWLALSGGVSLFRNRVGKPLLTWVNRISGSVIFAFGLVSLVSLFKI